MMARVREKGQITIPARIRESLGLDKDSIVSVTQVGDGILLTPGPSLFESTSAKFSKAASKKEISLDDLLKDLRADRRKKR